MTVRAAVVMCLLVAGPVAIAARDSVEGAEPPRFKAAEEMVEGWYHRHEVDEWLAGGARRATVDGILQRVAAAVGERRDPALVDTLIAYGPGHWVYEWAQAGEDAMATGARLAAAGRPRAAGEAYRSALTYFTTASWPHLGRDDDRAALARARDAYLALGGLLSRPVEHLAFAVGARQSRGYLHLPVGRGPFPLVLLSYGSDVTKESGLDFFTEELAPRGLAMFSVDLPGIGEASHIPLLDGSDAVLEGAMRFVADRADIDAGRIYVVGASFGGNAAARAFLRLPLAGVVSMCGPLHQPFLAPPEVLDALPSLTLDGVKARLGMLGRPTSELAAVTPALSLAVQGLYQRETVVTTPLLVVTTNADPVAPLTDLDALLAVAGTAETVVFDTVGHCPPRRWRQPLVARWIAGLAASASKE